MTCFEPSAAMFCPASDDHDILPLRGQLERGGLRAIENGQESCHDLSRDQSARRWRS